MKKKKTIKNIVQVILCIAIALVISSIFKISQVNGLSMDPTLKDDDIIIVNTLSQPKDNDIIIVNTMGKDMEDTKIVKRYYESKSNENEVWVEGDNKDVSVDSRSVGTFDKDKVEGVVILNISEFFRNLRK